LRKSAPRTVCAARCGCGRSPKTRWRCCITARSQAAKGHLVASFKGVADRDAAERLNGIELYISRDALPDTDEDEYYHADLIGLAAIDPQGASIGTVTAIHNFGAGDIIEIAPKNGPSLLLPFTNAVVPTVDLAAGHVVIEQQPAEIEGDTPDADQT
jgi:16S rRNA processing protein RimM